MCPGNPAQSVLIHTSKLLLFALLGSKGSSFLSSRSTGVKLSKGGFRSPVRKHFLVVSSVSTASSHKEGEHSMTTLTSGSQGAQGAGEGAGSSSSPTLGKSSASSLRALGCLVLCFPAIAFPSESVKQGTGYLSYYPSKHSFSKSGKFSSLININICFH